MEKKRIMVVEDEGITALRIQGSLQQMGYAVTSMVFSGEEAVEKAAEDKPDLVLMDISLRGEMDGIKAAGHIHSRLDIPVVYITARSDEKMLKRIKATEPFGYIIKPFDDRELRIAIEIALYKYGMEARLREREIRYRTLFKNANDAIYLIDSETQKIIDCNPKASKISSYTIRELKSMKKGDLYPLGEQAVVAKICDKISKRGSLSGISGINQQRRDGILVPVEINAATIKLEDKKYILCITRDISDRKKAEEQLRESEERFQILFEQALDSIVIFDAETGMLTQFNNKTCENLGYTRDEFKNLKLTDIEVVGFPDSISRHMEKIKKAGRGTFETKHRTKRGEIRDVLVNAKVIHIRDKKYIQSTWIDITERKIMEGQLKVAAITDDLTGLLNRRGFLALADQQCKVADRNKRRMSLLYLDIDGFKNINDELGHETGDKALIDTANMLKSTFRESDIIARIGGDEFVVLLTDPSESDIKHVVVGHLRHKINEFNLQESRDYEILLSVGMAHYDPERPCSIGELITHADDLMYEDKKYHHFLQNTEELLMEREGDRRDYRRYRTDSNCWAELDNISGRVRVKDISLGGVCLETSRQLTIKKVHILKGISCNNEQAVYKVIMLRSNAAEKPEAHEAGATRYNAGLKFIGLSKSEKQSLESFISSLAPLSSNTIRRRN